MNATGKSINKIAIPTASKVLLSVDLAVMIQYAPYLVDEESSFLDIEKSQ